MVKKKGRNWLKILAFFFLVLSLTAFLTYPAYRDWRKQRELRAKLERELKAKAKRNREIEREIKRLQSESYVEEIARRDFGLVKPGEKAYILIEPQGQEETTPSKPVKRKKSWWQKFVDWLKREVY